MRTLSFYGCSDDLFEIEDSTGKETDEVGSYRRSPVVRLSKDGAGLHVVGQYAPGRVACWSVGIMQLDEDVQLPDWPMRWSVYKNGYSTQLTIEVPDDVVVEILKDKSDD